MDSSALRFLNRCFLCWGWKKDKLIGYLSVLLVWVLWVYNFSRFFFLIFFEILISICTMLRNTFGNLNDFSILFHCFPSSRAPTAPCSLREKFFLSWNSLSVMFQTMFEIIYLLSQLISASMSSLRHHISRLASTHFLVLRRRSISYQDIVTYLLWRMYD